MDNKIEHFLYGMFNGKIKVYKSPGINNLLSDQNFHRLRNLTPEDTDRYLWLPTEQTIALPHITETSDNNGRKWVVNQTLLIHIHDYLRLTNPAKQLSKHFLKNPAKLAESCEFELTSINVKEQP